MNWFHRHLETRKIVNHPLKLEGVGRDVLEHVVTGVYLKVTPVRGHVNTAVYQDASQIVLGWKEW